MKYIDADLLKTGLIHLGEEFPILTYEAVLYLIDSIQQEPEVDLEKEISTWIPAHISGGDNGVWNTKNVITEWAGIVARHFAEWMKKQMMGEAVEGEIQMRYSGCLCAKTIRAINEDKFKLGDKVRIIVLPKEG